MKERGKIFLSNKIYEIDDEEWNAIYRIGN